MQACRLSLVWRSTVAAHRAHRCPSRCGLVLNQDLLLLGRALLAVTRLRLIVAGCRAGSCGGWLWSRCWRSPRSSRAGGCGRWGSQSCCRRCRNSRWRGGRQWSLGTDDSPDDDDTQRQDRRSACAQHHSIAGALAGRARVFARDLLTGAQIAAVAIGRRRLAQRSTARLPISGRQLRRRVVRTWRG